jgi:hypothetical protein
MGKQTKSSGPDGWMRDSLNNPNLGAEQNPMSFDSILVEAAHGR